MRYYHNKESFVDKYKTLQERKAGVEDYFNNPRGELYGSDKEFEEACQHPLSRMQNKTYKVPKKNRKGHLKDALKTGRLVTKKNNRESL